MKILAKILAACAAGLLLFGCARPAPGPEGYGRAINRGPPAVIYLQEGETRVNLCLAAIYEALGAERAMCVSAGQISLELPVPLLEELWDTGAYIELELSRPDGGALESAEIRFTAGGAPALFESSYTLIADLSAHDLSGINTHRITAVHGGRNIGGALDAGIFRVSLSSGGRFDIAYVSSLRRIRLGLDSYIIEDPAGGAPAQTMDVAPVALDGHTFVPLRFLADALGAEIGWDYERYAATLTLDGRTLVLAVGEAAPGMRAPAMLMPAVDGTSRTMVPLLCIAEFFGASAVYDPAARIYEIVK